MRFAYDRFGMGRYGYKEPDYKNPRAGYRNSATRGSVGLEGAMTQMSSPNGSVGSFGIAPATEPVAKMPNMTNPPFRAI